MKLLKALISTVFLLLFISNAVAEEIQWCFYKDSSSELVYRLDMYENNKEQIILYKQSNIELEQQVKLLKEVIALQKEQLEVSKQSMEHYKDIIKFQQDSYEKITKPNIFKEILKTFEFIIIGIAVGLLL